MICLSHPAIEVTFFIRSIKLYSFDIQCLYKYDVNITLGECYEKKIF